ncbi:AraC family transcriptional regulator [Dyella japonica A8]|uniref:AraC family transcriptional regulator n=2 Tax=Dyella japonica TaxID=231455 RepID=A0A075K4A4_9GAMM|nr:AraC family transcriptional regulator [Dyella japonica A8]
MVVVEQLDTVLITGASAGIGAAYADRFARRGHPVVLVARNEERLEALALRLSREYAVKAEVLAADLTVPDERARVERRLSADDAIGVLVNNAGIEGGPALTQTTPDAVQAMIELNVTAPSRLVAALLPRLLARGRGSIINIASILALAPELFDGAYAASKSYVLSYTQTLHKEVAARGIRVQCVLPGVTRTAIWNATGGVDAFPPRMIMEVDEMVDAALTGYDQGELVTIPSLVDGAEWKRFEEARRHMLPELSRSVAADRYKSDIPEDA